MFSKGCPTIDVDCIDEVEAAKRYLNISSLPCVISSPLRRDNHPSMGIICTNNRIYYTDFATKERGDLYNLLSQLWNCSFNEVLNRIMNDFPNTLSNEYRSKKKNKGGYKRTHSIIKCKVRDWEKHDIEYWGSYGIGIEWLKYADVYPVSHKIVCKDDKTYVFGADKYAYAYVEFKEGKTTLKIYQPFNTNGYKWSNNHDSSVISLWTKVPEKGKDIVICSSLKDALCLWANTGIPAVAVQGEGYGMSNTAISELKRRFANVFICFDNDEAGLKDGVKLSEQTGFINLVLPDIEGGKDISDYRKLLGKEKFIQLIKEMFNNFKS